MMLPKRPREKRTKKHGKSIMQNEKECYLCWELDRRINVKDLHRHHIFDGSRRKTSEREGFVVYLCLAHHTAGPAAVHSNAENMRLLQKVCQKKYEKTHTREEWMELIGKSYV